MHLIKSVSGIRGIVEASGGQQATMTPDVARDVGRAFATFLCRSFRRESVGMSRLIAARDGRPGGQSLLEAFAWGAWECGMPVIPLGITTTPTAGVAVAEFAEPLNVCGGVVITASHNPQQWNGIKFLLEGGRAPTPAQAQQIFDILERKDFDILNESQPPPTEEPPDVGDVHITRVLQNVDRTAIARRRFHVVLDSINGAGARPGRMLLEALGCRVTHINDSPEAGFGRNPEPTADNLREFAKAVAQNEADVGFAQDPDADRLAIVDENGRYIGEEYTLVLAAKQVFAAQPGPSVANLSTSRMIDDVAAAAGAQCEVHRSAVGEANVVDMMQKVGAVIGGEGNGGVVDPRVVLVRDSISAMALVLDLLAREGRPLSQIVDEIPRYAIVKTKVQLTSEQIAGALDKVRSEFAAERINDTDGVRIDWNDRWVHVRGSNTEPIMRIIAEAPDESAANELINRIQKVIG